MKNTPMFFSHFKKLSALSLTFIAVAILLGACSKMDAYKEKYVSSGEKTYTGKIDSVSIRSGNSRVKFKALLNPDPRVSQYKVYWGGRADSATFQLHTGGAAVIEEIINNVPEGEQTFEFVTSDAAGHTSVSTYKNGTTYGTRYLESLLNRTINGSALTPNLETGISLVGMDAATGAFMTEVRYLNNTGDSSTTLVPLTVADTFLINHKYGSEVIYRTWYLPDSTCIDTFYTAFNTFQPVSGSTWINVASNVVKNPGSPFLRSSWDNSRWGILADWVSNADVKNAAGYGGYELKNGVGVLSMEGGWSLPAVPNGKIYQVVHLPYAGKWRFGISFTEIGSAGTKYMAVSMAETLPDFDKITTAPYYYDFTNAAVSATPYIEFAVTEPQDVCIGFVCSMPNTGSYYKVKAVSLSFFKE